MYYRWAYVADLEEPLVTLVKRIFVTNWEMDEDERCQHQETP